MHQDHVDHELRQLFPKLRPVKRPPAMFTLNGFGLSVYGKRDFHAPTQSYIKTHCLCGLFIPLLALGAYRVVDAESGGWYFLGREPLSGFAKGWNYLLLSAVLVLSGAGLWNGYYNSPQAQAQRQISQADSARQAGEYTKAAKMYRTVLYGRSSLKTKGATGLGQLNEKLEQMPLAQARGVVPVLLDVRERAQYNRYLPKVPLAQMPARVRRLVEKQGAKEPRHGYELLQLIAPLTKNHKALLAQQQKLLVLVVAKHPNDLAMVSELASIYEKQRKYQQCLKLLEPLRAQLKQQEGARILGQIYFRKGRLDDAYKLLLPFTEGRLKILRQAEQRYQSVNKSLRNRIWYRARRQMRRRSGLRRILGPDYRSLSKTEKQQRYMAYEQRLVNQDPDFQKSRRALIQAARIVPAAMDLGIVMLYRARRLKHSGFRKKELQSAERIFLAIRGVAGRSSRYQLYLGQVYYWMGKPDKGQKLFDQVLKRTKRSYHVLMRLTSIMRELGEHGRASKLAEEAYNAGKTPKLKHQAAYLRALTAHEPEERIRWLLRSGESPRVTIALNSARGRQAREQGNYKEAAQYLRKAIRGYQDLEKEPANLNNCALVHFTLFRVTGDKSDFIKGVKLIEEALTMKPSDSIMLGNTAHFLLQAALLDVVEDAIDWRSFTDSIDVGLLSYLYSDANSKQKYIAKLMQNPKLRRAVSRYKKVMILAPKATHIYSALARLYWNSQNVDGLRELLERLQDGKFRFYNPGLYRNTRKNRQQDRKSLYRTRQHIKQLQRLVRQLRRRSKVDYAIAATSLNRYQLAAFALGDSIPARSLAQQAERAFRRLPSSATRQALIRALLFQASDKLARRNVGYARMLKAYKRHISVGYLLTYAIYEKPELFRMVRRDPALRKALTLIKQSVRAFPKYGYASEWALVSKFDTTLAQTIAARINKDPLHQLYNKIQRILVPNSPGMGMQAYFQALAAGKPDKAKRVWRLFLRLGAPMPSFRVREPAPQPGGLQGIGTQPPSRRSKRDLRPVRVRKTGGGNFLGGGGDGEDNEPPKKPKKRGSSWLE